MTHFVGGVRDSVSAATASGPDVPHEISCGAGSGLTLTAPAPLIARMAAATERGRLRIVIQSGTVWDRLGPCIRVCLSRGGKTAQSPGTSPFGQLAMRCSVSETERGTDGKPRIDGWPGGRMMLLYTESEYTGPVQSRPGHPCTVPGNIRSFSWGRRSLFLHFFSKGAAANENVWSRGSLLPATASRRIASHWIGLDWLGDWVPLLLPPITHSPCGLPCPALPCHVLSCHALPMLYRTVPCMLPACIRRVSWLSSLSASQGLSYCVVQHSTAHHSNSSLPTRAT